MTFWGNTAYICDDGAEIGTFGEHCWHLRTFDDVTGDIGHIWSRFRAVLEPLLGDIWERCGSSASPQHGGCAGAAGRCSQSPQPIGCDPAAPPPMGARGAGPHSVLQHHREERREGDRK